MATNKPFSTACERNRAPILQVLRSHLPQSGRLLEIGSGTGQHAAYFAPEFPQLIWQTSDVAEHLPGIRSWTEPEPRLPAPQELDVRQPNWPTGPWQAIYSANTLHIMNWACVEQFFAGVSRLLAVEGLLLVYGPFNDNGYTSASNEQFDEMLQARGVGSGLREFADIQELAAAQQLQLIDDQAMPANNRMLVWRKACAG